MTEHNLSSPHYDEGLEVDRQHEGLQYKDPYQHPPIPPSDSEPKLERDTPGHRNPCGLLLLTYGLLIALITAIVVGVAVGGGVGGALSSSHHSARCDQPYLATWICSC